MAKLNETLRQLRRDSGMTQEQVAGQLGVTRQAVSGYESDRTQPGLDILPLLAASFIIDAIRAVCRRRKRKQRNA